MSQKLIEALRNLCDEIAATEDHGDGAYDEDCSVCRAHQAARAALEEAEREQSGAGDCLNLVDRLRGIYRVPVNDGAGPLNGSMTHTREFETPPIQHEAAAEITRLRAALDTVARERDEARSHLADFEVQQGRCYW